MKQNLKDKIAFVAIGLAVFTTIFISLAMVGLLLTSLVYYPLPTIAGITLILTAKYKKP